MTPASRQDAWDALQGEDGQHQQQRPVLPGPDLDWRHFEGPRFHRSHTLGFKNGLPVQRKPLQGHGGERLVQDLHLVGRDAVLGEEEEEDDHSGRCQTYRPHGRSRPKSAPAFRPRYCFLDKKVLRFFAYFEELAGQDFEPERRVRHVHILYHLEDDTMAVIEPRISNSGLYQGILLRRHRIPLKESVLGDKAFWHWTDLKMDQPICLYGRQYHIHSCDQFTKKYLHAEGVALDETKGEEIDKLDKAQLQAQGQAVARHKEENRMRKFLENDGKVLRFYCLSDLPKYPLGQSGRKSFVILFYLADDSIEVREASKDRDSRKFLRRQRLPRTTAIANRSHEFPSARKFSREDFYSPEDFVVGDSAVLLNRRFDIYDCDDFTARYLSEHFGQTVSRPPKASGIKTSESVPMTLVPPHTADCIGDPEDSVQNCLRLIPKQPKKDLKKFVDYSGKTLRYEARLSSPWRPDRARKFVFTYFLSDDTASVHEMTDADQRGSKFLSRRKLPKPLNKVNGETDYYTVEDFYIGSTLHLLGRKFEIVGADRRVLHYLDDEMSPVPAALPAHCALSIRNYFKEDLRATEEVGAPVAADGEHERES